MAYLAALFVALAVPALAQEAGTLEIKALQSLLTGNVGLVIGLLLTVWGIWRAFVNTEVASGLFIMVCGVLLTIFPNFFNAVASTFVPLADAVVGR